MEVPGEGLSFLLIEDGEVSGDVFSDDSDFGEFGGTS